MLVKKEQKLSQNPDDPAFNRRNLARDNSVKFDRAPITPKREALAALVTHNGKLYVSERNWRLLNDKHTQQEMRQALTDAVTLYKIELPYKQSFYGDARGDFYKLKKFKTASLFKRAPWFSRFEPYRYKKDDLYIDNSNIGLVASDYFHQDARFRIDAAVCGPRETWLSASRRFSTFGALYTLHHDHVDDRVIRNCISMRRIIAVQFRPTAAKAIYDYFKAQEVLDFSMGWGDRLAGFHAAKSTRRYVGCDPNEKLHDSYHDQDLCYATGKLTSFICSPAEDAPIEKLGPFDLVFTSPPYFDREKYEDQNNTQSHARYKKPQAWLEGFLFKALAKSYRALKQDGFIVINLANLLNDLHDRTTGVIPLCDLMNDYLKSLGASYCGCLGLKLIKRPQSDTDRDGLFCEPVWVWRKGKAIKLELPS